MRIKYHYGGKLMCKPKVSYVGGAENLTPDIDPDKLDFWFIYDLPKQLGIEMDIKELYYETGPTTVMNVEKDADVVALSKIGFEKGVIDLYDVGPMEHSKEVQDEVIEPTKSKKVSPSPSSATELLSINKFTPTETKIPPHETPSSLPKVPSPSQKTVAQPASTENTELEYDWIDSRPDSPLTLAQLIGYEDLDSSDEGDPLYVPEEYTSDSDIFEGSKFAGVDGRKGYDSVIEVEEQPEPPLNEVLIGSDSDTSDDEWQLSKRKVNTWNASTTKNLEGLSNQINKGRLLDPTYKNCTSISKENEVVCVSEYEDSEGEYDTPGDSEEDDIRGKKMKARVQVVDKYTDFKKLQWVVGMRFPTKNDFKDAVTRYAIAQGKNLTYCVSDKNRNMRLGVKCVKGCPFRMYASWDSRGSRFIVRSVNNKHNCLRDMNHNPQLKSKWIAIQFLEMFKTRPHWPAVEIKEAVAKNFRVVINRPVSYKIKSEAHKMLHGSMKDHYRKIGSYLKAVKDANPNAYFYLLTLNMLQANPPVFQRLFQCFDGCRDGWLNGCRKVMCLDGCFIKTFLGGMVLSAIARDPNDQMFPLAWAAVEGENNESWAWFLSNLQIALGGSNGDNWTLISDQQKGLVNAVAKIFPAAEHRNCARHIFANWHKVHKGDELKRLFWNAVRAYNEADFNKAMDEMKGNSPTAVEAFRAQNPSTFCRAFIKTHTKCDVIVNNMAETFNGYIIHARSLHMIDMLEGIRSAVMERLAVKRMWMEEQDVVLCPRIQAKLDKAKDLAAHCHPIPSTKYLYQVRDLFDTVKVDLEKKTCTCRKWDLTGIPCSHVVSCAFLLRCKAEELVDGCYTKPAYLLAYAGKISPGDSERFWTRVDFPLDPPPIKIMPGRPRKNRIKDPHEIPKKPGKLTRHGVQMTCSVCGSKEHTKKKCPKKDDPVPPPPAKRPRGRPKKDQTAATPVPGDTSHHNAIAHPTNTKRRPRKTAVSNGRKRQATVPRGYGLYINSSTGNSYVNGAHLISSQPTSNQSQSSIPISSQHISTQPTSSQASVEQNSNFLK